MYYESYHKFKGCLHRGSSYIDAFFQECKAYSCTNSDIIKVKVIEIDKKRERIGLSMKNLKEK